MTPKKIHSFGSSKRAGDEGERLFELDIAPQLNLSLQKPPDGSLLFDFFEKSMGRIEVKRDLRAEETGNFFLETEHSDGRPAVATGIHWDTLVLIVGRRCWLFDTHGWLRMVSEEARLAFLERRDSRIVSNASFKTHGILVPLTDLDFFCSSELYF